MKMVLMCLRKVVQRLDGTRFKLRHRDKDRIEDCFLHRASLSLVLGSLAVWGIDS